MLNVSDALHLILTHVDVGNAHTVAAGDAWQHILAQDIPATCDSPPFDKSLMDGFAVSLHCTKTMTRSASKGNAETVVPDAWVALNVAETVTAGQTANVSVDATNAVRIMTGAPLPAGTDCVVPIEFVEFDEQHPEFVSVPVKFVIPDSCILRQGAVVRVGNRLLSSGTRLQAQHLAVLAEFGMTQVNVMQRPTVAILATGDELIGAEQPLEPGRIRNSNQPMLTAQITQSWATPIPLGIARDNVADLSDKIRLGLQHDFLLLTGGVSAGILDLVPAQLAAAGVEPIFHGVHMKPGKPLWFGAFRKDGHRCSVFGLPGNPVSTLACFELFVRTALRRFQNDPDPAPRSIRGILQEAVNIKGNRPTYYPCAARFTADGLEARPVLWSGSSDLRATTEANSMALLKPSPESYPAGSQVDVFLWDTSLLT